MLKYLLTIHWSTDTRSGTTTQEVEFPTDAALLVYIDSLFRDTLDVDTPNIDTPSGRSHPPPFSVTLVESQIVLPVL